MNEKKYVIPEGMLKAASGQGFQTSKILEAALRWLAENPIAPTPEQHMDISGMVRSQVEHDDLTMWHFWAEWQRRMFLAPEPEIPEAVKDLLCDPVNAGRGFRFGDMADKVNDSILEAYRRGRESK